MITYNFTEPFPKLDELKDLKGVGVTAGGHDSIVSTVPFSIITNLEDHYEPHIINMVLKIGIGWRLVDIENKGTTFNHTLFNFTLESDRQEEGKPVPNPLDLSGKIYRNQAFYDEDLKPETNPDFISLEDWVKEGIESLIEKNKDEWEKYLIKQKQLTLF